MNPLQTSVQNAMMPPQMAVPGMNPPAGPVQAPPQAGFETPMFNPGPAQDNFMMQQQPAAMPAVAPAVPQPPQPSIQQAMQQPMPGAGPMPSGIAQPGPSDAELAALLNMLSAPKNQPGAAANAFSAPASSLQTAQGPNGEPMVLESAPMQSIGNAGSGGGFLKSPLGMMLGAAAVAGGIFLGIRMKNKSAAGNAFEKLSQEASGLKDKITQKLGLQDELDALHTETSKQVQLSVKQYQDAINGVAAKQEAADQLTQKTDDLFEHAKGLPEGETLADNAVKGFTDAVENFKAKVVGDA